MKCSSGKHEWTDGVCAARCCNPEWTRITILPGERLRDVLGYKRVAHDGIHHAPDGFRFAWMRTTGNQSP